MGCSSCSCEGGIAEVYVDALAPEKVCIDMCASSAFDPMTAIPSGSDILVIRSNNEQVSWALDSGAFDMKTTEKVRLCHTFVSGDLTCPEDLTLVARVVVPGGIRRGRPVTLRVLPLKGPTTC